MNSLLNHVFDNFLGVDFLLGEANLVAPIPTFSAAKLMSSTFILKLYDEGLIDINEPVRNHISWWTGDENDPRSGVTVNIKNT